MRTETDGTVTLADGTKRVFFTRPAGHGAGIFDITVDGAGMWAGKSLDGSTLEADQTGPTVDGLRAVRHRARCTASSTTTSPAG